MSNYTKTTNFAAKDSLPSGNANKIVKGTEIDTEFDNIATASATKADIASPTFTGTVTIPTVDLNGGAIDGTTVGATTAAAITGTTIVANTSINIAGDGATVTGIKDEDDMSSNSATKLATQQSIKAYVDSQVTAQDLDFQADSGGALSIDLDSETLTFTGGTGVDTSGSGNAVTFAIDSTVATLTGTQTLTNKTLTSPTLNTPTIGTSFTIGSATITEAELEILDGATVTTAELNVLDGVTSTTAELNILDGVTSTAAELNILDGVTSTAAELNILDGVTSTTAELNILDGVTSTTAELNILDGVTASTAELNIMDGVTATTAELNILDGVTATATELNLLDGVTATTAELNYVDGVTSAIQTQIDTKAPLASPTFTGTVTADGLTVDTDTLVVDATNNRVGIGASSPNYNLTSYKAGANANYIQVANGSTGVNSANGTLFGVDASGNGVVTVQGAFDYITSVAGAERMRIDSSGNLMVGTTDAAVGVGNTNIGHSLGAAGYAAHSRSANASLFLNRTSSDGEIARFSKDGTAVGQINARSGDMVIGTGDTGLQFYDVGNAIFPLSASGNTNRDGAIDLGEASNRFKDLYLSGQAIAGDGSVTAPSFRGTDTNTGIYFPSAGVTAISRNGVEGCRMDASGNLLVGTTSTTLYDATSGGGIMLDPDGPTTIARDGQTALYVNRTSTHGDMVQFRRDGATVGRLSNNNTYFFISGGASGGTHSGLRFVNNSSIRPCTSAGANSNNVVAFGATSARWTVIYATTGTINTSDRREKQDIEALSDAEQRVAVAAKGLLRKFRWIDAVEAKGDDARIHFGIIAQDLQDAFTAEGLDAGRYAMFCSDTFWIDTEGESYETQEEAPEGATEQTRLGVRYSELLAFIISAI